MKKRQRVELMGRIVTVDKELVRRTIHKSEPGIPYYSDRTVLRSWESVSIEARAGWVVGFRSLKEGKLEPSFDEYVQHELVVTGTVPCVLVAFWPTQNPIKVPLDGYRLGGEPLAPSGWDTASPWYQGAIEEYRKVAKAMPRDEKGRWLSWDDQTDEQREKFAKEMGHL